jgi:hypothetical protein
VFRQMFFYLFMRRNGLTGFSLGILIPIVLCTVSYEHAPGFLNKLDEFPSFHATSSSATLRTHGILPLFTSL